MKRLYKSSTDKQVMGVCGGLAEYFNIDPTLIRVVVAIAAFVFGFGIIPYIILGIILPYDYQVTDVIDNHPQEKANGIFRFGKEDVKQPKDVTPQSQKDEWADF